MSNNDIIQPTTLQKSKKIYVHSRFKDSTNPKCTIILQNVNLKQNNDLINSRKLILLNRALALPLPETNNLRTLMLMTLKK